MAGLTSGLTALALTGCQPMRETASGRRAWFGAGDLMVIQNMGLSVQENDDLLRYPVTGHFRYGLDQPA